MSVKWNVSLKEAIEVVSIIQEAAVNEHTDMNILDVGGGTKPLIFASHVMDAIGFEKRASQGVIPSEATVNACHVTHENWILWDLNITPWPIPDKRFDVVWCTDVLGELRDPVAVIKEMCRVGKTGYIKVTHMNYESLLNVEDERFAGYGMNRWFIEPWTDALLFTYKHPYVNILGNPDPMGIRDIGLWWTDDIKAYENIIPNNEGYKKYITDHIEDSKGWRL